MIISLRNFLIYKKGYKDKDKDAFDEMYVSVWRRAIVYRG